MAEGRWEIRVVDRIGFDRTIQLSAIGHLPSAILSFKTIPDLEHRYNVSWICRVILESTTQFSDV